MRSSGTMTRQRPPILTGRIEYIVTDATHPPLYGSFIQVTATAQVAVTVCKLRNMRSIVMLQRYD